MISDKYRAKGVKAYYEEEGSTYRNPHEEQIKSLLLDKKDLIKGCILDLSCGSGEVTLAIKDFKDVIVSGVDPYCHEAYFKRVGKKPMKFTFNDIEMGALNHQEFNFIICSFAMHLVDCSRLPRLCYVLAQLSQNLIIITPHKRPEIKSDWGWKFVSESMKNRVRLRHYQSYLKGNLFNIENK